MWATAWHRHKWTTALLASEQTHGSYDRQHRMITLSATLFTVMAVIATVVAEEGTALERSRVWWIVVGAAAMLPVEAVLAWTVRKLHRIKSVTTTRFFWQRLRYLAST